MLFNDPIIQQIIDSITIPKLQPKGTPFEAMCRNIIYQQLSNKTADSIYQQFQQRVGTPYTATTISELSQPDCKNCGLSAQKYQYLQNVAQHYRENTFFWENIQQYNSNDITKELCRITGVGPWTVQMLLIFHLEYPDVVPLNDLVIKKQITSLYKLQSTGKTLLSEMQAIAQNWSPNGSLATRALWIWNDQLNQRDSLSNATKD